MPLPFPAIDAWVNPNLATDVPADRDVDYLFPGLAERRRKGTSLDELVAEMDEAGVEKAVLAAGYGEVDDRDWVVKALDAYPERFAGSLVVDPRRGMDAVREVEFFARNHNFRMVRLLGFVTQLPYDHAYYFPIYARCVDLGLVCGVNVGIPGPRVPGKHQHPLAIDEVCYHFPELKLVFSHGGEPWANLCVKLMLKWPNLHYMTSAFAPRHLPEEIVQYVNTRGTDRVMWASDYPLLTFARCLEEIGAMPLRDEERRRKFARENALRLFWPEQNPGDS
ncbi:MAG: amidohydrolase family protein [Hyphomicrobiales bacterium]